MGIFCSCQLFASTVVDEAKTPEHLQHTEKLNYVCASLLEETPLDLCLLLFDATNMTVGPQLLSKNVQVL